MTVLRDTESRRRFRVTKLVGTLVVASLLLAIGAVTALGETQTESCHTALIIIDMQNAWLGGPALTADGVQVQERVAEIADTARSAGMPVVFVIDVSRRGWFTDEDLQIVDPLQVLDGEPVVEKTYQNGFYQTLLEETLRNMGVTRVLVTGYASDGCVRQTVAGAVACGFEVLIVEDGHSGGGSVHVAQEQNQAWRESGLSVVPFSEIDFAALCASSDAAKGEEGD
jgi:nicotinamidase-related amidase